MDPLISVLVIDDDEINNFLCQKVIKLSGFSNTVATCQSADEGINKIKESAGLDTAKVPDLIFLDINMPLKNGWDFLEDYEALQPSIGKPIKIFMLSSSVYKDDISRAKESKHVTDYVTKPLTEEILNKIKQDHYSGN